MRHEKQDYYIYLKQDISMLDEHDRDLLMESVFKSMVTAMRLYYSQLGLTEVDSDKNIEAEVESVKHLIKDRLLRKQRIEEIAKVIEEKMEPMDEQFSNDALIDLHFMMDSVSKPN